MSRKEPSKRRGRPKLFDKRGTLEIVTSQYWAEGVHALSLNEVCRRAQISKPTLYREFESEDGLMREVLLYYRELVIIPVLKAIETPKPFAESVEELIMGMTASSPHPAGCLFTEMRIARTHFGPMTNAQLNLMEQERHEAFAIWYKRALTLNEANAELTPELAARYIDSQFTTLLLQMGAKEPANMVRKQTRLAFSILVAK